MIQYAPFVGRRDEQNRFQQLLSDASQQGAAVLVVGPPGFGKTSLLDRFTQLASNHPELRCGAARYELTPTDSPDSTLAIMIDHAYEAANVTEGSFEPTDRCIKQWKAILNVFKIGDLALSLRRDPAKNSRDQFLDRIRRISAKMPENARALFCIDPEKYLMKNSHDAWRLVVQNLPPKIIFVFAQRPDDCLVNSHEFLALDNLTRIPQDSLDILDHKSVSELIDLYASDINIPAQKLESALAPYQGHPYAVHAALLLLKDGLPLTELPPDPKDIAAAQFRQICSKDPKAVKLFKAYALLEVAIPDDVVQAVSDLSMDDIQFLLAQTDLPGYLRFETAGRRIYHALLADFIKAQLTDDEAVQYHRRAIEKYRTLLQDDTKPSPLAALRLSEHILVSDGKAAFIDCFISECTKKLKTYGLYDSIIEITERALKFVKPSSSSYAALLGNLGLIYRICGQLDLAEDMHKKALEIEKKLGRLDGQANQYGNLGLIYQIRGELDRAEIMYRKVLEIEEQLGRLESISKLYGNLGIIYQDRGELDRAEDMHKKALEIDLKIERFEGQAAEYGNLGNVYITRGDLERGKEMFQKALEIHLKLGGLEGQATDYNNLGNIYLTQGDLDRAEDLLQKSLKIYLKLGHLVGQANQYGNLGLVYESRGDLKQARSFWRQARQLYQQIGIPHMVKQINDWLNALPPESPD
jgi:tetratricopeptide (TPR) repeat protein